MHTNDHAVVALLQEPQVGVHGLLQRVGKGMLWGETVLERKDGQSAMGILAASCKGCNHALKHGCCHGWGAGAKPAAMDVQQHGGLRQVVGALQAGAAASLVQE